MALFGIETPKINLDWKDAVAPGITLPGKLFSAATGGSKKDNISNSGGASASQLAAAKQRGLDLGQLVTGQDLQKTGGQIQDVLSRQLAMLNENTNPVTGLMTGQKNSAVAQTAQGMAKAGVRGGAAQGAKLQTARAMDKDIAAQAYQNYQKNLQGSAGMVSNVLKSQLAPIYQEQQVELARNAPQLNMNTGGGGIFTGFMDTLFG